MTDTETPWTPGPWKYCGKGKPCSCGYIFGNGDNVYVAKCLNLDDEVDPVAVDDDRSANARLIATAPEQDAANRKAREALEPFGNEELMAQIADDEDDEEWAKFRLLIKNYRAAAEAIAELDRVYAKARGQ